LQQKVSEFQSQKEPIILIHIARRSPWRIPVRTRFMLSILEISQLFSVVCSTLTFTVFQLSCSDGLRRVDHLSAMNICACLQSLINTAVGRMRYGHAPSLGWKVHSHALHETGAGACKTCHSRFHLPNPTDKSKRISAYYYHIRVSSRTTLQAPWTASGCPSLLKW